MKKISYLKVCKFTSTILKLKREEIKIIKDSGTALKNQSHFFKNSKVFLLNKIF